MKKMRFIFIFVMVLGIFSFCSVHADSTVLYNDGTLIINEKSEDRKDNITAHGSVNKEYEPLSAEQKYEFSKNKLPLWYSQRSSIKSVEIGQKISPTSTAYWFKDLDIARTGIFNNLDTSKVTNMSYMFYGFGKMLSSISLDLSNWNTSNVTDMSYMFSFAGYNAENINITSDLSNWDTSNVTNMSYMFADMGSVSKIWNIGDLTNWDTSNVTNMSYMFKKTGTEASTWNVGNLTNWDTSNVTNMSYMFSEAGTNANIWNIGNLINWDTSNVTNMSYMFNYAGTNANTWNIGDLSNWNTSNVTDMSYMFSVAGIESKTWNIGNLANWDTSNVTNMSYMFSGLDVVSNINDYIWNIGNLADWDTSKVTNMSHMFFYAGDRAEIWNIGNLSKWDTSNVTDMSYMFSGSGYNAKTWNIGNLTNWNTSKVRNMSYMFQNVGESDKTISIGDLINWDTSKVTNMSHMFYSIGYMFSDPIDIGTLKIPSGCNVTSFGENANSLSGNIKFFGNVKTDFTFQTSKVLSRDVYSDGVRINLYYDNIEALQVVEDLIDLSGNQRNIFIGKYDVNIISNNDVTIKLYDNLKNETDRFSYFETVTLFVENTNFKDIIIYNSNNEDITTLVKYNNETNTFVMPDYDVTIKVIFEEDSYSISKHEDMKNGSVEVVNTAIVGDSVNINITPAEHYKLSNVTVLKTSDMSDVTDKVSYNSETNTFIMPDYDVTINVQFLPIEYNISPIIHSDYGIIGGNININGKSVYNSKVNFDISIDTGYLLKSIKVLESSTGKDISSLVNLDKKNYTFIMPEYDVKMIVVFAKKPSAPKTVTTKLYGHDDVKFSWSYVYNADGYLVYYKKSTSKNYTLLMATTATSIKKANLTDGVKYYFKVVPYAKDLNGVKRYNSYKASSIYTLKKLNTPIVSKYSKNYVKIKWNNISGESGYQIARRKYGTSTYYIVKNVSYKYSSTILKTTRGKTYYYKVRAYKIVDGKKIYGPWSYVKSYKLR